MSNERLNVPGEPGYDYQQFCGICHGCGGCGGMSQNLLVGPRRPGRAVEGDNQRGRGSLREPQPEVKLA